MPFKTEWKYRIFGVARNNQLEVYNAKFTGEVRTWNGRSLYVFECETGGRMWFFDDGRSQFHSYRVEILPAEEPTENHGYHLTKIVKGVYGELSKVREELDELVDGESQGNRIIALNEASDLIGALEGWLENYHPGVTLDDLRKMSDATKRAFENGRRK